MSRFSKLSHVLWHCQYHIVWVPKYRYRVLTGKVGFEVLKTLRVYTERLGCEVVEINIQPDHVHLLVKVPPKVAISKLLGTVKGKTALQIFKQFPRSRGPIRSRGPDQIKGSDSLVGQVGRHIICAHRF
ncbi:MAG: IS200/IS605 family transposase [Ectothiorhodospiraceae bacterium]|nr:IS200/IS605 family transposase [Ectothiorhodospiraceae bacterium]